MVDAVETLLKIIYYSVAVIRLIKNDSATKSNGQKQEGD